MREVARLEEPRSKVGMGVLTVRKGKRIKEQKWAGLEVYLFWKRKLDESIQQFSVSLSVAFLPV